MADLNDISALIATAQAREKTNPADAHCRYETAERSFDNYLLTCFGLGIDWLKEHPDSDFGRIFYPYYEAILQGYQRLNDAKEA
jgi:hypothetical protein